MIRKDVIMEKNADITDMAQALLRPASREMGKKLGVIPLHFTPPGNFLDRLKDARFQEQLDTALGSAAKTDQGKIQQLIKGMWVLSGSEITPEADKHIQSLSNSWSDIAPYFMRWMPDTYDSLHGTTGSVASLTKAIAESNKHRNVDPRMAYQQASGIANELMKDPKSLRGFSLKEIGDIYAAGVERGLVAPMGDIQEMTQGIRGLAGVASASRDMMGSQGLAPRISDMFELSDRVPSDLPLAQKENYILRGGLEAREGGSFMAALRDGGQAYDPSIGMLPQDMAKQHARLTQNAATSPLGNQVAATLRLNQLQPFQQGTPGAQLVEDIKQNKVPRMHGAEWAAAMAASGVSSEHASQILQQPRANSGFMTPEAIQAVQASQYAVDIKPVEDRIRSEYDQSNPVHRELTEGALDQLAATAGYKNYANLRALHNASQGVPAQLARFRQDAESMKSVSHVGRGNMASRFSEGIADASRSPQPDIKQVLFRGMGHVPKDAVPQNIKNQFSDLLDT